MRDKSKSSNTYIIEPDMNANYIVSRSVSDFCICCGNGINKGRFCDGWCRSEYYREIHSELSGFGRWE